MKMKQTLIVVTIALIIGMIQTAIQAGTIPERWIAAGVGIMVGFVLGAVITIFWLSFSPEEEEKETPPPPRKPWPPKSET